MSISLEPKRSLSCPHFAGKKRSYPDLGRAAKELREQGEVQFAAKDCLTPNVVRYVKRLVEVTGVEVFQSYVYVPDENGKCMHVFVLTKENPEPDLP